MSPPVTRRLRVAEQTSLAELHAALQVAFGWSDEHLYTYQIRGWQFGDPARAIELALAGGGCRYSPRGVRLRAANPSSINTTYSSRVRLTAASKREV